MNDLISRQAAIDACINMCKHYTPTKSVKHPHIDFVVDTLKALPSAEPERKKGKWIRITQGAIPAQYMCPFCHRTVESYGVEELLSIRYPYCHCGADMRGDKDE